MTPTDTKALRGLEEKATPGPWRVVHNSRRTRFYLRIVGNGQIAYILTRDAARGNADLIAAARNALPSLLTEVEELRWALESIAAYAPRGDLHFDAMIEIARAALSRGKR